VAGSVVRGGRLEKKASQKIKIKSASRLSGTAIAKRVNHRRMALIGQTAQNGNHRFARLANVQLLVLTQAVPKLNKK